MVRRDHELRVEHRPLCVGALRAVRELRQVPLPRRDRLGKLLLPLQDRTDLERCIHRKLRPIVTPFRRTNLSRLSLEELRERFESLVAPSSGEVRRSNLVRGSDRFRMSRVRTEESPQRRDALVQTGVVRRIGKSIGCGDRVHRVRPDRGRGVRKLGRPEPLDLPRQIGPRSPRQQRLIEFLLGLTELEAHPEPVLSRRVLLNVKLVIFDCARGVAGSHARTPHRVQQACPEGRAFSQLTGLDQQVIRRVRVRRDQRVARLEKSTGIVVIDPGKLIFPIAGKKPFRLRTR